MKQTIKRYDERPYDTDFQARIISAEAENGTIGLILDQTLFFPEEGGQNPDSGTIEGFPVMDVQIKNGVITHKLACTEEAAAKLVPGSTVSGSIEWAGRFSNMQNHTGEHILSGILYKKYGYNNVGFHLSPQIVTLDTSGPLTEEQVRELERAANQAVWENVAVKAEYPPEEQLADMFYRSKTEIDGPVRVVTIEGYDACACCAPHVRRTGEIGLILILKHENYKGGTRFTFVCGNRALEQVQKDRKILKSLTDMMTTSAEDLPGNINGIMTESEARKQRGDRLMRRQAEMLIGQQPETEEDIRVFDPEYDVQARRILVNGLVKKTAGYAGIFCGDDENGYDFVIGSEKKDARAMSAMLKEKFGARGGGSPKMVQGHVNAGRGELEEALTAFQEAVLNG